jgi:hypothetical protein
VAQRILAVTLKVVSTFWHCKANDTVPSLVLGSAANTPPETSGTDASVTVPLAGVITVPSGNTIAPAETLSSMTFSVRAVDAGGIVAVPSV